MSRRDSTRDVHRDGTRDSGRVGEVVISPLKQALNAKRGREVNRSNPPVVIAPCTTNHRKYRAAAKCIWPEAVWISGNGPYAVLAWCDVLTISMHPTKEAAWKSQDFIDRTRCGGQCHGDHESLRVDLDHQTWPAA